MTAPTNGKHNDHPLSLNQQNKTDPTSYDDLMTILSHWKKRLVRRLQNMDEQVTKRYLLWIATIALATVGYRFRKRFILSLFNYPHEYRRADTAPLSLLYQSTDSIDRALIGPSAVYYLLSGIWKKSDLPPNGVVLQKELFERLSKAGCRDVSALPESLATRLATPILAALPFVYLAFLYKLFNNMNGTSFETKTSEKSTTTFRNVAGMDSVVLEIAEVVDYLRGPARYQALGAQPLRGVLLHGPPGTGKTLLARAVAGEASVDCFIACSASDFVELYVGRGAARVRSLFAQIRSEARQRTKARWYRWSFSSRKPSAILFIDELDALAKSRSSFGSSDEREQTLNQLLIEMDGFQQEDITLTVIAATNRVDILDPAIIRRFDRQIHVGYPDCAGRKAILQMHARNVVLCSESQIDWSKLAADSLTGGFSGADLRNVINEAALLAVRDMSDAVFQHHLEASARKVNQMKSGSTGTLAVNSRDSFIHLYPK